MIDAKWFLEALQGDRVIVRMHVMARRTGQLVTEVHAFTRWNDDMLEIGGEIIYRHDEKNNVGVRPLEFRRFPPDPDAWADHVAQIAEEWPTYWDLPHEVVCTVGRTKRTNYQIGSGHPLALSHLARFQAIAAVSDVKEWGVELSIVARRLEGMVRGNVKGWRQLLIGQ